MNLPIDASSAPFRHKYLTEETAVLNRWCVQPTLNGSVDVIDDQLDIFTRMSAEQAARIVAARDAFCSVIEQELALP